MTGAKNSGNKVREVRQAKKLTMEQLGERIGVHFTTIAKIERSQRGLSGEMLAKLAAALGVTPSELTGDMPGVMPVRSIPIVGEIAAGNWQEAVENPEGYINIPLGGPNAFALRPRGSSMNKITREDALIVVDPDKRDLIDGGLYAVMNSGGETTYKMFKEGPPRLEPLSDDPQHQAIPLGRETITVIGKIVGQFSVL